MLKAMLALKHKTIPRSINVTKPPKLRDGTQITESALYINTRTRPWFTKPGQPRRVGVSSFGFGGANYHCVLEEYEHEHTEAYRTHGRPDLIFITAASTGALTVACGAALKTLQDALTLTNPDEASLARWTKNGEASYRGGAYAPEQRALALVYQSFVKEHALRMDVLPSAARVGFVAEGAEHAVAVLSAVGAQLAKKPIDAKWTLPKHGAHFRATGAATAGRVAAVFSGQGAQYAHMFEDTAMDWPPMRNAICSMDEQAYKTRPADMPLVSDVLYPRQPYASDADPGYDARLQNTLHAQPATVAVSAGAYACSKRTRRAALLAQPLLWRRRAGGLPR
jgi:acyl transferase domain-containing protein